MSTGRGDANFTKSTSLTLAMRAGFRCSVPQCDVVTIGPGDADGETASVGMAAHIHSASPNGPRGRGGLSDVQLSSVTNGIWCCYTHGKEIDANSGRGYAIETLLGWKAVREDAARHERSGLKRGLGWVSGVVVDRSPLFRSGAELRLEKALLIEGESVGKSAFFEWLGGAAGNDTLMRWTETDAQSGYLRLIIKYHAPAPRELEFEFDGRAPSYKLDSKTIYSPPSDLSIVLLGEDARRRPEGLDDIEFIAHVLATTRLQVKALIPHLERSGSGYFERLRFEEAQFDEDDDPNPDRIEPYLELLLQRRDVNFEQSMGSLSGSELGLLLIDFACALARAKAESATTLLLLEVGSLNFARETLRPLAIWLIKQKFQTLMIVTDWQIDAEDPWPSWSAAVFKEDERLSKTIIE